MPPRTPEQFQTIRETSMGKIRSAAFELFGTKGYGRTTISDIANAAGISKGLIYNYFKSKEDILKALLGELERHTENMLATGMENTDPREQLRCLIDMVFDFLRNQPKTNRLITALELEVHDVEFVTEWVEQKAEQWTAAMAELFRTLGTAHPKSEARVLAATLDGIAVQHAAFPQAVRLDEVQAQLLRRYRITDSELPDKSRPNTQSRT